jgi:hypothetical protein
VSDLLGRSDDLDKRIAGSDNIDDLVKASQRSRRSIRLLTISIVLDIALTIGLGLVALRAQQASDLANSNQARQYQSCLNGNASRAGQIELWTYIISLPTMTPRTPAQQAQADSFLIYVKQLYGPLRCVPPK